jgi:hypothetical protein
MTTCFGAPPCRLPHASDDLSFIGPAIKLPYPRLAEAHRGFCDPVTVWVAFWVSLVRSSDMTSRGAGQRKVAHRSLLEPVPRAMQVSSRSPSRRMSAARSGTAWTRTFCSCPSSCGMVSAPGVLDGRTDRIRHLARVELFPLGTRAHVDRSESDPVRFPPSRLTSRCHCAGRFPCSTGIPVVCSRAGSAHRRVLVGELYARDSVRIIVSHSRPVRKISRFLDPLCQNPR